jgi:hypothetical protein
VCRKAFDQLADASVQDALNQRFLQLVESPTLEKTSFGSRPDKSSFNVPFSIAITPSSGFTMTHTRFPTAPRETQIVEPGSPKQAARMR